MAYKFEKNKAKRIERGKSGHPIYIYDCPDCSNELRVRHFKRKSNKCRSCCQKKRPFNRQYWNLKNNQKVSVGLTYKDFLEYTKITNCYYCQIEIKWEEYNSNKYYLDRKDNNKGYSKKNCVVCCTKCNYGKSNRYTHEEWYGMTQYFRNKNEKSK